MEIRKGPVDIDPGSPQTSYLYATFTGLMRKHASPSRNKCVWFAVIADRRVKRRPHQEKWLRHGRKCGLASVPSSGRICDPLHRGVRLHLDDQRCRKDAERSSPHPAASPTPAAPDPKGENPMNLYRTFSPLPSSPACCPAWPCPPAPGRPPHPTRSLTGRNLDASGRRRDPSGSRHLQDGRQASAHAFAARCPCIVLCPSAPRNRRRAW